MALTVLIITAFFGTVFTQSLNFVAVGDYGGQSTAPYTTPAQVAVAKQMGITAASLNSNFTLGIGDNFYETGINGNDQDARFSETWKNVYTATSLQSRWYIVAGNHDHYGNVTAEVAHTADDQRWYFPALWYTETFNVDDLTLQMVFFDTVIYADYPDTDDAKTQRAWIENTLATSKADWLVVVGHYPVYSIAEHGPTPLLVSDLRPMLLKYNVDAYFSGHDHSLQHLNDGTIDYFLTGAGHLTDNSNAHKNDVPPGYSKFFWSGSNDNAGGFISVSVTSVAMTVNYISDDGTQLYQVVRPYKK